MPKNQIVMLAHTYEERRVTYPCFVQPKLNGIRAYYRKGNLYSRDRKLLAAPTHITEELRKIGFPDDVIFDGELYKHSWPLQRINGAVGVNREMPTDDTRQISFCIFDFIQEQAPFAQRMAYLLSIVRPRLPASCGIVEPILCHDAQHATYLYEQFMKMGFEGMMYRIGGCLYRKGMRSYSLLKRKDWKDDWFPIVGKQEGKATELGSRLVGTLGSLICQLPDGRTFDVGSGFTDSERDRIWKNELVINQLHVRYEMLSDDGIPLKPTAIEWKLTIE